MDRRRILEKFGAEYGHGNVATIQRQHIEKILTTNMTPATALHLFICLKEVFKYAVRIGMRMDDPMKDIRRPKYRPKSDGLYSWTDADLAAFETRWPIGTTERLAMALGRYTGQRRSDVIRLGRQNVKGDEIHFRQQKTGTSLVLPLHPVLKEIIDRTVSADQMVFLQSALGRPFGMPGFAGMFKKACAAAGLPEEASFHGLRKAAARRLAEQDSTANEIASLTGHKTLTEVSRYTKAADQQRLAKTAMGRL